MCGLRGLRARPSPWQRPSPAPPSAPPLPRCPIAVNRGRELRLLLDSSYVTQRLRNPRAHEAFRLRRGHRRPRPCRALIGRWGAGLTLTRLGVGREPRHSWAGLEAGQAGRSNGAAAAGGLGPACGRWELAVPPAASHGPAPPGRGAPARPPPSAERPGGRQGSLPGRPLPAGTSAAVPGQTMDGTGPGETWPPPNCGAG